MSAMHVLTTVLYRIARVINDVRELLKICGTFFFLKMLQNSLRTDDKVL